MKNVLAAGLLALLAAPVVAADEPLQKTEGSAQADVTPQKKIVLSEVYTIDRKFRSMEGPQSSQNVYLTDPTTPELLWLTGFRSEMVGEDGTTPMLPELMCHVNLDLDIAKHSKVFKWQKAVSPRILTLSQGQLEARFPAGFGVPLMSDEPLMLTTQVLNLNLEKPDLKVRHRVTFEFVRDKDLKQPLNPLYNTGIFGMALVEGDTGIYGVKKDEAKEHHGTSCMIGQSAPNAMGGSEYRDPLGRVFTGHWVVKPGREVNHTNVTSFLALPFDTTLHYAAVHLHPFAESLELRDLTTNKTLFRSVAEQKKDGVGLVSVSSFSSVEGIPLYKDHEYELVSVYNNTTKENVDSMAVMYLSPLDKEFTKPVEKKVDEVFGEAKKVLLNTVAGAITLELYPSIAPKTVEQIVRLVEAGAYDTTSFVRIEPGFVAQLSTVDARRLPLSDRQKELVKKIPLESTDKAKHTRGFLSLAHPDDDKDGGETSFSILLGDAPHLDGNYTVFGRVSAGLSVVEWMERAAKAAPTDQPFRVEVFKAEVVE